MHRRSSIVKPKRSDTRQPERPRQSQEGLHHRSVDLTPTRRRKEQRVKPSGASQQSHALPEPHLRRHCYVQEQERDQSAWESWNSDRHALRNGSGRTYSLPFSLLPQKPSNPPASANSGTSRQWPSLLHPQMGGLRISSGSAFAKPPPFPQPV